MKILCKLKLYGSAIDAVWGQLQSADLKCTLQFTYDGPVCFHGASGNLPSQSLHENKNYSCQNHM